MLFGNPLPDDGIWMSGDLHPAHAFTGDNCQYCHETAFVSVTDAACLSCHQSTSHHFDQNQLCSTYQVARVRIAMAGMREEITREDQELYATCHQDMHGAGYANRTESCSRFLGKSPLL